jgi:hypothetical protein
MSNYCHNAVRFSGPLAQMVKMKLMFADIEQNSKTGLPDFVSSERGGMLEISVGDDRASFRTSWVPNLEVVHEIAEHFGLDYVHKYEEPNMFIYGEASWKDGEYQHVFLEMRDLKGMDFDPEEHQFKFRGKVYNDDFEIWIEVLEEKKKLLAERGYLFQTESRVSKEDLTELFGDLPEGDLFLKLAERKNFAAAEAIFDTWDDYSVNCMENYLISTYQHLTELNIGKDEYIAMKFLDELITGIYERQKLEQSRQPGRSL